MNWTAVFLISGAFGIAVIAYTIKQGRRDGSAWGATLGVATFAGTAGFCGAVFGISLLMGMMLMLKECHMRLTTERSVVRVQVPPLAEYGLQQLREEGRHRDMPRYLARWFPYPWFEQANVRTNLHQIDGKTFAEVHYYPNQKHHVTRLLEAVRQ